MTGSLKLLAPWLLPIELPQPPTHKKKTFGGTRCCRDGRAPWT